MFSLKDGLDLEIGVEFLLTYHDRIILDSKLARVLRLVDERF